ncbi:hypothetical protein [Pontibacter sp. G13]|uniref:hypothetical protein n=1 Tax=Pontibacter sp. G13 TaxID=3074898 RepID=UPI00288C29BC|nr:hypothetical protein [Pontibacter sp. G13]WNJ18107.1 hypothetical protein RJD25_24920 [Pontibacter sp. G13]
MENAIILTFFEDIVYQPKADFQTLTSLTPNLSMGNLLMISAIVLVILGLVAFVFVLIKNRQFAALHDLHETFAQRHSLKMAYADEHDFKIYGEISHYQMLIQPMLLLDPEQQDHTFGISFTIPMHNPNRKALRIFRTNSDHIHFKRVAVIDHALRVNHGIGDWLEIQTNDLLFSSIILSNDVKISLYEVFNQFDAAVLYIQDAEMTFVTPKMLKVEADMEIFDRVIALMVEMKDELN